MYNFKNSISILKKLSIGGLILAVAGCATIFKGSSAEVRVNSTPNDARIVINNNEKGTTPSTLSLERDKDHDITFKKEGYEDITLEIEKDFDAATTIVGNIFSWGILGIAVDFGTGAAYSLKPADLKANMEELEQAGLLNTKELKENNSNSDIHVVMLTEEEWKAIKNK